VFAGLSLLLAVALAPRSVAAGAKAVPAPAVAAVPGVSAPPAPSAEGTRRPRRVARAAAETTFNSCREVAPGQPILKLNLKPDTDLSDLVDWISSVTCKAFIVPGSVAASSKKVTIIAPSLITRAEAYRVFLNALDSVGLTVEPSGRALKIIETAKAKSASIPLYGFDGRPLPASAAAASRATRP
jgi:general secretion pathway protein D